MEETEWILVRHGETAWNVERRIQGHLDSPLTETGRRQAAAVARRLRNSVFSAFYTSDLGRAFETARAIAGEIGQDPIADRRLRERAFGIIEGKTVEERANLPADVRHRAGEGEEAFAGRVEAFFEEMRMRHPGERLLVVTHGGVLSMFIKKCLGLSLTGDRPFALPNAAVNRVSFAGGRWTVQTLGDTSHLENLHALDDSVDRRNGAAKHASGPATDPANQ